jgi:hypothetical protein
MDAMNGPRAEACRIPEMDDSMMRLTLHPAWRSRTVADAAVAAYSDWRSECAAVRASYRRWVGTRGEEEPSAFSDYRSALDREEHAAGRYARLMRRAGHLDETGVALRLARIETGDESS